MSAPSDRPILCGALTPSRSPVTADRGCGRPSALSSGPPGRSTQRSPSRSWSRQLCQWCPSHALLNRTSTPRSRKKLASARFSSASPSSSPVETKARVAGSGGARPKRPHQPGDAGEHRMRPARELALVEDERAGLQHQPAEAPGIAEGGGERGHRPEARPEQHPLAPALRRARPARLERRQQLADEVPGMRAGRRNIRPSRSRVCTSAATTGGISPASIRLSSTTGRSA